MRGTRVGVDNEDKDGEGFGEISDTSNSEYSRKKGKFNEQTNKA